MSSTTAPGSSPTSDRQSPIPEGFEDPRPPQPHFLEDIAFTAEMRDDPTGEHGYRVARLAGLLWEVLGETSYTPEQIEQATRLHDIGKAAVSDDLLLKAEAPSPGERQVLNRHAAMGAEMIGRSDHPLRELAADIARFHHETFDGTGSIPKDWWQAQSQCPRESSPCATPLTR
jgi:response regulator RpfG family c-di-GMP phosphodiesterase